jgi:hypothetical protein
MDSKVKLRYIKLGKVEVFSFEHAQNILRLDGYKDFECADDKYKFIDNKLIKQSQKKKESKPKEDK